MNLIEKSAIGALALCALPSSAKADVVTDWNRQLLSAIRSPLVSTPPPKAARAIAMVNVAMFDAIEGVDDTYFRYHFASPAIPGTSAQAAAAQAAFDVLFVLFPQPLLVLSFTAQLTVSLSGIDPVGRALGIAYGHAVAADLLAARSNDGSSVVVPYVPGSGPGVWIPTPPAFAPALLPNWPQVTCFCLPAGNTLRSPAPPALTSAEYTAAFNEVKSLGKSDSATRTADQTQIALFWADGGGTATPPGHWVVIADALAVANGWSLSHHAQLMAQLGLALADAAIVAWDNKYAFNFWRPLTAIRAADTDGNPATDKDRTWQPLITTPPFPSYTSGHSTFSGAAAAVLAERFHTDHVAFSATSDGLPGVTRSFSSFSQAAVEAGRSRIYGGIHYEFDNSRGLAGGDAVGDFVTQNVVLRKGDVNLDDHVDLLDIVGFIPLFGTSDPRGDLNHDGVVDARDLVLAYQHLDGFYRPL